MKDLLKKNHGQCGVARRSLVLWTLAAALVAIFLGILLWLGVGITLNIAAPEPPALQAMSGPVGPAPGETGGPAVTPESGPAPETILPAGAGSQSPESRLQAYVTGRVTELAELGRMNDPDSLNAILSELTNRDPRIRKAALDATMQFGNRDAIPSLADAALQTDDPREKVALLDAIEFLKLPSLTQATHP